MPIKPGKIGPTIPTPGARKEAKKEAPVHSRDIWDDYAPLQKKQHKKQEFERGAGGRMVPKSKDQREGEDNLDADIEQGEPYKPRMDYETLEAKLDYTFKNRELLSRALTHRSALGLQDRTDYERLEFLGDAVLDLAVAHLLSDRHPEAREGELSKMRAALVNTQALAEIAQQLDLGPFIRLGRGEHSSGGAERPSILADVTEAVVGAMYRDSSYDISLEKIEKIFGDSVEKVTPHDPKTELQEALHLAGSEPPSYLLEMVEGPEHAPTFVTIVMVDGEIAGRGRGTTKKSSQQDAAGIALLRMAPSTQAIELVDGQAVLIPELLIMEKPEAPQPETK